MSKVRSKKLCAGRSGPGTVEQIEQIFLQIFLLYSLLSIL